MSLSAESQNGSVMIQIDRGAYRVAVGQIRGDALRQLPNPPLSPEYDLFMVEAAGEPDRLVSNDETVALREGMRFFSAPRSIRAGCSGSS